MNLYRNTKTGAEIQTPCVIAGDGWESVLPAVDNKPKETPKTPAKKAAKNGNK